MVENNTEKPNKKTIEHKESQRAKTQKVLSRLLWYTPIKTLSGLYIEIIKNNPFWALSVKINKNKKLKGEKIWTNAK